MGCGVNGEGVVIREGAPERGRERENMCRLSPVTVGDLMAKSSGITIFAVYFHGY